MTPETVHCYPLATPKTPLVSSRTSPKSRIKQILHQKYYQGKRGRMKFTKYWKLLPALVLILSSVSIFRFLKITMITSSSSPSGLSSAALPPILNHDDCSPHSSTNCTKNVSRAMKAHQWSMSINQESNVTDKEMLFLLDFLSRQVPCNILVFGLQHQYSRVSPMNAGGLTVFLEDENQNHCAVQSTNHTQVYKVKYRTRASEAYQLLKETRKNPECRPNKSYLPENSKCSLASSDLPQNVYNTKWDVVIVDGPDGGKPDSPGRMAAIYTAGVLARRGNTTHILVHDVDRMIERWFSWELLCEENLVSSKGRFWHFHVLGTIGNATTFCSL